MLKRYIIPLLLAIVVAQVLNIVMLGVVGSGIGFVATSTLVTIILVGGMAYLLAAGDAALTSRLLTFASQLEANQQPEAVDTRRTDELGQLATTMNRLTNRDKAVQQANSDALTGLANRRGVMQKLANAFKNNQPLSLFYIDLDKFKPVNDQYGHEMGDAVLKKVAEIFLSCARDGDTVARLGGDEFILVFYGLTDRKLIEERARKIIDAVSEPMWVNDVRIKLGASVGITIAPEDATTVDALLNASDETMYAVKKAGRNGFKFYS